jgi:hypothetical protein
MKRPATPIVDGIRVLREMSAVEAAEAIEQPLLDYLAAEFGIDDKLALREAILTMAHAYEGAGAFKSELKRRRTKHAAQLDALADASDLRWTLADKVRQPDESLDEAAERVGAMLGPLQAAAREVPRLPRNKGGRPGHARLRALVRAAAEYWLFELGKEFKADHTTWRIGPSGTEEPRAEAERFCFEVVRYLLPGKEGDVRTAIRPLKKRLPLQKPCT